METPEYDWPCDRHEAHGCHRDVIIDYTLMPEDYVCPGVGAHPATMIGRNDVHLKSGGLR